MSGGEIRVIVIKWEGILKYKNIYINTNSFGQCISMKEACRRQCASFRYVSFTYSIIYVQDKCFVVQSSLPRPSVV